MFPRKKQSKGEAGSKPSKGKKGESISALDAIQIRLECYDEQITALPAVQGSYTNINKVGANQKTIHDDTEREKVVNWT